MKNFMPINSTTDKMDKSLEKYNSPKMIREIYSNNYENRLLPRFLSTTCHPKCMTCMNSFSHH